MDQSKIAYAENTFSETEKSVCVPSLLERTITCKCSVCLFLCVVYKCTVHKLCARIYAICC